MTQPLPVADRLAIADLMADYCELVDAYDIDAVARLFTSDCVRLRHRLRPRPRRARDRSRRRA